MDPLLQYFLKTLTTSLNNMSGDILVPKLACICTNSLGSQFTNPQLWRDGRIGELMNGYGAHVHVQILFGLVIEAHAILVPVDSNMVQVALEGPIHFMLWRLTLNRCITEQGQWLLVIYFKLQDYLVGTVKSVVDSTQRSAVGLL